MTAILLILALILLNGALSMAEMAIASARRRRLEQLANDGNGGARVALTLADDPSAFLSTIQIGITLISILNGAYGESSLAQRLVPWLASVPAIAPYARSIALGVVIISITLASILFGELVPKRIALHAPEAVAALVARPLQRLSRLMAPLVKLLALLTDLVVRLLGLHQARDEPPTEGEIGDMLREGTDAGVLEPAAYDIARRAMRLDTVRLSALMTPRIDLPCLDLDDAPEVNLAKVAANPTRQFPVFAAKHSELRGIVHAGGLLQQALHQRMLGPLDIAAAAQPPLLVPASATALDLLGQLRARGAELALVVDEHGQLQGMVTLADLMGALVGGVPGAAAREGDAVQREDGSWLMDGAMPLERLRELLGTAEALPDEAGGAYQTLAGFVLHQLGHVPAAAEHVDWNGWRFEVVDLDRNRIDRVLISAI